MKEVKATYFKFNNYVIDYINYKYNHKAKIEDKPVEVHFSLGTDVNIDKDNMKSAITLKCNIFENAEENNFPFSLEIALTGYFSASKDMDLETFTKLTRYNGTAILFPYLRSAVSDVTKAANVNPLILPVINIANLIKRQEEKSEGDVNAKMS
jgi:preprotein translocase subunit SecB